MIKKDFYKIGCVKRKYGKNGEFIIALSNGFILPSELQLFLNINDADYLPVFIEYLSEKSVEEFRVKFYFPFNEISLDGYLGKDVYVYKNTLNFEDIPILSLNFIGWKVMIDELNMMGEVIDIVKRKIQDILLVQIDGNEIMIPLHDNFIINIDEEQEIISLKVPEELLNIN